MAALHAEVAEVRGEIRALTSARRDGGPAVAASADAADAGDEHQPPPDRVVAVPAPTNAACPRATVMSPTVTSP